MRVRKILENPGLLRILGGLQVRGNLEQLRQPRDAVLRVGDLLLPELLQPFGDRPVHRGGLVAGRFEFPLDPTDPRHAYADDKHLTGALFQIWFLESVEPYIEGADG